MTCLICHRPLSGRAHSLAVPTAVTRRAGKNAIALAFAPWDELLAKRPETVPFCGARCSCAGLERFLQSGHLGKPNSQEEEKA